MTNAPADPLSRRPARLLRRRRPRHQDRRDGAREMGRAGLCPARDRAQQVRRRRPARQGRGVRRGTGRVPARPPGDLLGPWRAEVRPRRGRAARDDLCRCHLPAGHQGPHRGRAPSRGRPADGDDRPCGPSRDDRHDGPAARRRGAAGRDRGRCGATLQVRDPAKLAFITQTTLSVDDTAEIVAALQARVSRPSSGPHKEDICYATTNRQAAVKADRAAGSTRCW